MPKKKDKKVTSSMTTEFEIEARRAAFKFLYKTFYTVLNVTQHGKQIQALVSPDTMSDEDWALYVDLNWKIKGLISEEIN
jgi:hypothetical protein